jgi:hypothetical protein
MPRAAICAADILKAWLQNDRKQLNQKLATDATADIEPARDSHERERMELLNGIATEMRNSIASGQEQAAGVYISLLRHLATTARIPSNRH